MSPGNVHIMDTPDTDDSPEALEGTGGTAGTQGTADPSPDTPEAPEGTAAQTPEQDQQEAAAPRRMGLRRALFGLVAAAVLGLGGALGFTLYQQSELHRLQAQATDTTRDYLVAMASFDYQNLDANKGTITSGSTPEFAAKYDEMVSALRDIVVTSKGVATASADHVAVERMDDGSATVIGFVDQAVTNVTSPEGNKQRYRMVVSLVRDGDQWLVNDVQTV